MASGWPPCLHIIAATALLVHDADKLTYGQQLWVYTPHAIEGGFKAAAGAILAEALAARKPAIACHPGSSPMRTPAYNYTLGGEKDLDTSPAIPYLGVDPEETKILKDTCTQ